MTARRERIAWRRAGGSREYAGSLLIGESTIRLRGRDPWRSMGVALSIPLSEIEAVRLSGAAEERVRGEGAVVLDLAGSRAICLRDLGALGQDRPFRQLQALAAGRRAAETMAASESRRRERCESSR
ncbi:MAG: hypothetical protein C4305_05895 [Thermoleophilia bacterium]